ncbi:MAG TPA: trypsin-like peptidase domain-containing protein [Pseudogracilibacillus sp.]|nr:trypsin-like peptidase domain-containing protein [Pseudogracilibacillus sp.]
MGYYSNNEPPTGQPEKKKSGWILPIVIALTVGILLLLVIYPNLSGQNIVLDDEKENDNSSKTEEVVEEEKERSESVRVDVSTQITDIVEEVSPAVVGVTNLQMRSDFWQQGAETSEAGTGSGVIYKKDDQYAYIVTNQHVVTQADAVEIVLSDETNLEAEILGTDLFTDLAVLRVAADKVGDPIELGSSETLKVGEPVIAIGNPLGHMFAGSVTQGIISGKQRTIPLDFNNDGRPDWQAEVIQTDAAINPGNSGGALINIEGKLIGINSMKINQQLAQGIGFAIPIDTAKPIIEQLETTGQVTRPFMGVEIYSLEEVPKAEWKRTLKLPDSVEGGVYIWSVEPLSPAEEGGLKRLDVITEFDGREISNILELRKILYEEKEVGDDVDVVYYRNGKRHETTLTLTEQK